MPKVSKPWKRKGTWFLPVRKPKKPCGCVYSLVGYPLYLCPKHEAKGEKS